VEQSVERVIERLTSSIRVALGEELVGLYAYGSAVVGGFEQGASDIDLLAVLTDAFERRWFDPLDRLQQHVVRDHPGWDNRRADWARTKMPERVALIDAALGCRRGWSGGVSRRRDPKGRQAVPCRRRFGGSNDPIGPLMRGSLPPARLVVS
jgi:predicted nucleotidyltransferase